ncbi:MAG: hypothetical protein HOQ02_11325, partial [Lysobacter sp.]|nr:hypothetical protein [Lysobacter sp.]
MAQNLFKREGTYYARVAAPKPLKLLRRQVGARGRNEVWVSLHTKDQAIARRALPAALEGIYRAFEAETAALLGPGARDATWTRPVAQDFESAAWTFIRDELRLDEQMRSAWPSQAEIEKRTEATLRDLQKNRPASD